jgi:hypothetical protein
MMPRLALAGLLLTLPAAAQPAQPVPTVSAPVEDLLASAPHLEISNGLITARIAAPDLKRGFFRGTRFDHAGVITSLRYRGRDFYRPWFDRTAPEVLDYAYDAQDRLVGGPDSAASGPVEEFGVLDFEPRPGLFVKIGVGVLRQPDSQQYDKYRHYEIVDAGKRTTKVTRDGVSFTQALSSAGTSYIYQKTLRLVPGKPQLVIEHRLKNTGSKPINSNVYDHNFLTLTHGNRGVRVTFPFPVRADNPPPADLLRIDGNAMTYLRPMKVRERISFPITGFGPTAADYDFNVEAPESAGVRIQGDQPITRINIFSIDKVQSVEPYIGIDIGPGEEKHWRYSYQFRAPS